MRKGVCAMPFVTVKGAPRDTPQEVFDAVIQGVKTEVAKVMGTKPDWFEVYFPADLSRAEHETLYVSIDTGLFFGKEDMDELAKNTTQALAQVVWDAFKGRYAVEVFVNNLNIGWRSLKLRGEYN